MRMPTLSKAEGTAPKDPRCNAETLFFWCRCHVGSVCCRHPTSRSSSICSQRIRRGDARIRRGDIQHSCFDCWGMFQVFGNNESWKQAGGSVCATRTRMVLRISAILSRLHGGTCRTRTSIRVLASLSDPRNNKLSIRCGCKREIYIFCTHLQKGH